MTFPTFNEFFAEVHGYEPYHWQQRLSEEIRDAGTWPWHVNVPTGLGKTSCIDIAVYDLARSVHGARQRTAPQRIFHVVDRRTIIDGVVDHARHLARRITESPVLQPIRGALAALTPSGSDEFIHVTGIHGDDPDDLEWMQRSTGCTIVSLTSHQFVSRLLFRGYGVSAGNRPLAAALTSIDRLVLFDEPHLSVQAVHTILGTERLQSSAAESLGLPDPRTVLLGATVPESLAGLRPGSAGVDITRESATARARLEARRPTRVEWVSSSDTALTKALAGAAQSLADAGARRTVVFANTVATAQDVYRALRDSSSEPDERVVRLVTSRFRPFDKTHLHGLEQPGIVVTTQTLEVGVDTSFDALVTELCPWGALLQRLGRFNRYGEFNEDDRFLARPAVIVAGWNTNSDNASPHKPATRVYGPEPLAECARVLRTLTTGDSTAVIDMNPVQLAKIAPDATARQEGQPRVGTLTSAMLPLLAQTKPTPEADIPLQALIDGPDVAAADEVEVAWRDRLDVFDLDGIALRVYPAEVVSVPRSTWARFLGHEKKPTRDLADLAVAPEEFEPVNAVDELRLFRIWSEAEDRWDVPTSASELRDARRVVVSSMQGGYSPELGWTGVPGAEGPLDVSAPAVMSAMERQRPGEVVDLVLDRDNIVGRLAQRDRDAARELIAAFDHLQDQLEHGAPREELDVADLIDAARRYVTDLLAATRTRPVEGRAPMPSKQPKPILGIFVGTSPEAVVVRVRFEPVRHGGAVPLSEHQAQVGAWAGEDAGKAGLPPALVDDVAYAGAHHDDGKQHTAFQRYLGGGVVPGSPLAKSALPPASRVADRRLRLEAGIPEGWRHEAESVRLLPGASPLSRHLVGAHHGWFRPVVPPVAASSGYPGPLEHADDFARLNGRFGVWGLAYLETLVRMADWRASAAPWDADDQRAGGAALASSAAPTLSAPARAYRMIGLHSHPMTGWFAAVGLLAAASAADSRATLRWESLSGDAASEPSVPVLATHQDVDEVVHRIIASEDWSVSLRIADRGLDGRGLAAKNQKVGPADGLHCLLLTAEEAGAWLFLGLVNDLAPAGAARRVPLAMAPIANNASYVDVAVERLESAERPPGRSFREALGALFSLEAGFERKKCDGGMDRVLAQNPGVNGTGDPVTQMMRAALAPLALYGIASLGAGPIRGIGVVDARTAVLPLPTREVTFPQLRALTFLGRHRPGRIWAQVGLEWAYVAEKHSLGQKQAAWRGAPLSLLRSP